jgi:hypothetical protein
VLFRLWRCRKTDLCVCVYNETVLRAWQANMDIKFVTSANAVIHYILDCICKPEQELGEGMKSAIKDLPAQCAPRE